jgi:hypothetical protein
MTGWRIEPTGLNKILTDTGTAVEAVGTALEGPADTPAEVQSAAGFDGLVLGAFNGFMQELYEGTIANMFTSYQTALEGTANAANAYLAGDEEIATTIASGIGASDFGSASYTQPSGGAGGGGGGGGR